jgi:hypothetical protein
MVLLYVKGRGEEAPLTRVTVNQVEGMAVQDLLDAVAQKLNLDRDELHLMYGGRVLKCGKTLDQYKILDGCTLHILQKRKKVKYVPLPIGPEGMAVVFASSTIQREIAPFISNPDLVTKMIPLGDSKEVQEILRDPDLLNKISDIARINQHIRKNYLLFPVMQALVRLHRLKYSVCRRDDGSRGPMSVQFGQILEMAGRAMGLVVGDGGGLEEGAGQQDSLAEGLAFVQEQPSQPIQQATQHPPNPHTHGTIHPVAAGAGPSLGATLPSFHVTTADLASALANIGTDQSQPSSLQSSSLQSQDSSQPSSLQLYNPHYTGSSAPASLHVSDEATHLPPPISVNRSLSDSGRGGTGTGHDAAGSSISQVDLQQALNLAMSSVQQSSTPAGVTQPQHSSAHSSATRSHHHGRPSQRQLTLRERYLPHLEQLHAMGITYSDSECLHALEAAGGDLQMALEILMGPGK